MSIKTYSAEGLPIYVGASKALVTDNKDSSKKGQVKVSSPVIGNTGFIPCRTVDDGFYSPPDVGSVVYIEFAGGNVDYPVVTGIVNDGPESSPDTPSVFQRNVPTNRGWETPGQLNSLGLPDNIGHTLELDDGLATIESDKSINQTAESRGIRLTTIGGHSLKLIEEGTDGSQINRASIETSGNQAVQLIDDTDSAKQQVIIKDVEERTIEIIKASDRIRIRNQSGTIFIDVNFANDTIEIDANSVKLGTSAGEAIVRGDTFRTLFNTHTHPTPAGPSLQPFEQMDLPSANTHLSSKHKIE